MIKKVLLLIGLALILSGCKKDNVVFYVISYDPVKLYEEPSENSQITQLLSLTGGSPRGCFDSFEEGPKIIKVDLHSRPVPIGVRKMDSTGNWGYLEEWFPNGIKGWVKMADVLWCGTGADNELWPAYTVKGKATELYRHPRKTNEEVVHYNTLNQGDTVRLLEKRGTWAHVKQFKSGKDYVDFNRLGWVPLSELKWADSLSVAYVGRLNQEKSQARKIKADERKAQAAQAKAAEKAKPKSKYRQGGVGTTNGRLLDDMGNILRWLYGVGAVLAVIFCLAFYRKAEDEMFEEVHLWSLIGCAVALAVGAILAGTNNWFLELYVFWVMLAFIYVVLYPLFPLFGAVGKTIWFFAFRIAGLALGLLSFVGSIMFLSAPLGLGYVVATFAMPIAYIYVLIRFPIYFMDEVLS